MIAVFSEQSRKHAPPGFIVAGQRRDSPERPERIDMLMEGVKVLGLAIKTPPAIGRTELETIHSARYLDFLETLPARWARQEGASPVPVPNIFALGGADLVPVAYPDSVIGQAGFHLGDGAAPVLPETMEAVSASAATAFHGAGLLLGGETLVYALCRPPGHHASREVAAGFCYVNNSALAAEALVRAGRRVAILDIDVHHGNGTEALFYRRADVLTVSLHVDPKRFYPFFWGGTEAAGEGEGLGRNLNLPLPRGTDDSSYCAALSHALDAVRAHGTDTLVIAAGLDGAADDPFKGFALTEGGFERIGRDIAALNLPMLAVQEGGYPSPSLGRNLAALLGGLGA
jgi:acetoin utilization deacetylase AcuC-like enzyme